MVENGTAMPLSSATPREEDAVEGAQLKASEHVKLEALFDSDDDDKGHDDNNGSNTEQNRKEASADSPSPEKSMDWKAESPEGEGEKLHQEEEEEKPNSEIMYAFYQRLFPFKYLFQWLNHGALVSTASFSNREFAFTLQNEAYLRYQSYENIEALRRDVLRLNPSRFEIGPVYSINPRDRKSIRKAGAFKPTLKELVFDIDLTDYDDIRTCCTEANICKKCWTFVTMAMKVIDVALREDFGFRHILWVYSGRRGAHCWVCDTRARNLTDEKRRSIALYLEVIRAGKPIGIRRPLHPHILRSLDILKPYFASTILSDQDTFASTEQEEKLLEILPDRSMNEGLRNKWHSAPERPSKTKWADIDTLAKSGKYRSLDTKALLDAKQDAVLQYTYPRLDSEVSKKLIHLLKSPFVVHPGTGKVCVPIDMNNIEQFDPLSVPTVMSLISEINNWDKTNMDSTTNAPSNNSPMNSHADRQKHPLDYEKTSLKPYIHYFRSFVIELLNSQGSIKRERPDENPMEF